MKKSAFRSQHGMSIVELMIAITLSLVLTLGVFEIFSASKQSNRVQNALGQLQGNARFALDIISYDIRMAGQLGCNSAVNITNNTGVLAPFGNGITGYEHSNLPAVMVIGDDDGNPKDSHVKDDTDVIFTRYAQPSSFVVTGADSGSITLASSDHNIEEHDPLIVSDCESSDIFIAGKEKEEEGGESIINIGTSEFSKTYGTDAELARLVYRAYYIKEDTSTLYRRDAVNWDEDTSVQPTPILEGFEDIQILYGIDTNGDGSSIKYIDASTVSTNDEWGQVSSVRITLVLSTEENNVATTTQSYWINGSLVTLDGNNDNVNKKIFRAFTTTIKLRNKGLDT